MDKFLSLLGFARKAGKLTAGFDASVNTIKDNSALLLIASCDISEKTLKNLRFEADKKGVEVIVSHLNTEEISHGIGKKAGVLSVTDKDFVKGLKGVVESRKD